MTALSATYTRFEMLRLLRNRQGMIFSLAFPIVMYFLLAAPNKDNHNFGGSKAHPTGIFAPQYYMVSLLAFGGLVAKDQYRPGNVSGGIDDRCAAVVDRDFRAARIGQRKPATEMQTQHLLSNLAEFTGWPQLLTAE